MPNRFRLQSDDEKNKYLRQLYGGDPPSMEYYSQLGRQKAERLESEKKAKEQAKALEKEEENRLLQELIQTARQPASSIPEMPTADSNARSKIGVGKQDTDKQGFFNNIAGLGKDVAGSALHMAGTAGKGLLNLGKVVNPFSEYSMEDMRKDADKQAETNVKEFVPYSGEYSSNLSREVGRGVQRAGDAATFGLMGDSIREQEGFDESAFDQREGAGAVGDVLYSILGSIGPGGIMASGIRGTQAGARILPQMSNLQKAGQYAKEGLTAGTAYGAMDAHATELRDPNERTALQHLGNIGMEAGLGAVLDPAIMGLSNVIGKGLRGRNAPSPQSDPMSGYDPSRLSDLASDPSQLNPLNSRVQNTSEFMSNLPQHKPDLDSLAQHFHSQNAETSRYADLAFNNFARNFNDPAPTSTVGDLRGSPTQERPNALADLGLMNRNVDTSAQTSKIRLPEGSMLEKPKEVDGPITFTETDGIFSKLRNPAQTWRNAKSKIGYEVDSKAHYAREIEEAALKLDPSNQANLKILSDGTLDASDSFYKSLRQTTLAPQKAAHTFREDYMPIISKFNEAGIEYEDFSKFAAAKHFDDILRNNADKAKRAKEIEHQLMTDTNLSDAAVDRLVKEMDSLEDYILPEHATPEWINEQLAKWGDNPQVNKLQQDFVKNQKKDLKTAYEAGMYTEKQFNTLYNTHDNYVSMRRDIEGLSDSATNNAAGRTKYVEAIRSRKRGSLDNITDPIENALQNRVRITKLSEMNKAKSKLANLAKLDKDGLLVREVSPRSAHIGQKNVVVYKDKGIEKAIEVPPNLYNTLENFGGEQATNAFSKFIQSVGRFSKKGMTHFNPKFHLKASVRDTQNAFMTSRSGANPIDYAAGFMDAFFGPQLNKLTGGRFKTFKNMYQEMGGEYANWIKHEPVDIHNMLQAMKKGKTSKRDTVLNPFKWVESLGAQTEMGPRLGEVRAHMRKSNTPESAMLEAIDVIDYKDLGNSIESLNKYIPYLGPTIRGNLRFMRAIKEKQIKTMVKGFSNLGTATAGIYMMRFADTTNDAQRQKLENMPEWQKNLFWAIPNPSPKSDGLIMIPKGFLVGQVFSNPIERMLDHMYGPENKDAKQVLKETGDDFAQALVPPTAMAGISTIMELMNNQDSFLGMPIVTDEMQDLPKPEQFDEYTSEAAKLLGKWMGLSPAQVDHVLK